MGVIKSLFLLAMAASSLADRSAPVLVWESTMTEASAPALPALPAMSNSQLQNLLDSMDNEALVMFIMNELNVEDFSGYPEAFTHLRQEFESSESAFTPSMADPSQLPAHLSSYSRVTVNVDDLSSLKLAAGAPKTLFLVYLKDRPAADRQTALQETDAVISQVLTKVKSLTGKYSAVLTGKHTTMGGQTKRRSTRSLKAAADDTPDYFHNLGCVFIYTSAAPVMRFKAAASNDGEKRASIIVDLGMSTSNSSACNDSAVNTATLTWKNATGDSINLTDVTLTFSFNARMSKPEEGELSSWTLAPVTLTYSGTVGGKDVNNFETTLKFAEVYAPKHFSYHCTNRSWTANTNASDEITFTALELPGFQVQAFLADDADVSFGRPWDCTPFFTIPIWSGLFLSLIMLLVLIWSIMMLASVPTMDRFDDPRGQPLHVTTTE